MDTSPLQVKSIEPVFNKFVDIVIATISHDNLSTNNIGNFRKIIEQEYT